MALFVLAAALAWLLSKGPLTLDALSPYIENALMTGQQDMRLKIGHASLRWKSLGSSPVVTVESVQAIDRSGVIGALPRMDVEMSLIALLHGDFAPETISLSSPILRVTRRADGTFAFGVMQNASPTDTTQDNESIASVLIDALTRPASEINRVGYLQRIAITDSTLVVRDEVTGERWLVPNATLTLNRAGADVELAATLPVIDKNRPWSFAVKGRYAAATRALNLTMTLDGFHPAGIADLATQLYPLRAVDLGLSGQVAMRFTLLDQSARLEQIKFDLKGDDGTLHLPEPLDRSYTVKSLVAKGDITSNFDHIALETLRLDVDDGVHGPAVVTVAGEGTALNTMPNVALDIGIDDLSLDALKSYWPEGAKENARRWIVDNLNNGDLSDIHFHVALGGPSLDQLALTQLKASSEMDGIDVTYMKGMPAVEDTSAHLDVLPGEVDITFTDGTVPDAQTKEGVQVTSGVVRLTALGSAHEHARVKLGLTGDLGEVMRLIDHEPLGYAKSMGLDARQITGTAAVDLDISFPLISALKLDQLQIAVKAKVDGAKVPNAAFGQPLTDSHLALSLDRNGMDTSGTVTLAGIQANVSWRENFSTGDFRSRYDIEAVMDNAQRPLVVLKSPMFAPPYVDGPVQAHVIYTAFRNGTSTIEGDADLREAVVGVAQLGWSKPVGDPGHATFNAAMKNDQLAEISAFHLTAGDTAEVAGAARFGTDDELAHLSLTTGHIGDTSLTGELARDEAGVYHLDVNGPTFNSTYFWREMARDDNRGAARDTTQTPFVVNATFDRMWLAPVGDFRDVRLSYAQGRDGIEHIDFASQVDGVAPFTFVLNQDNGKRVFHGQSTSGGSVVRAVGLFDDIVGGALKIDGELAADGSIKGRADISNLNLVQAPVVARLLSVASLTGIVDELRGKGISFKLLRVPFTYANSTIRISNGEMYGSSIGLTAKGGYNFSDRRMDFNGTIIPAYAINNVLSSIPLIGPLLTGTDKGGGVLAATYRYQGDPATAQPSVNPLAALAPGIMRHIFDIFHGHPAQSAANPSNRPATPPPAKDDSSDATPDNG